MTRRSDLRVCGVIIVSAWDLRRAARRVFPGSIANQRRWMRAWLMRPREVRVAIASCLAKEPDRFSRESHIPEETRFRLSSRVQEYIDAGPQ